MSLEAPLPIRKLSVVSTAGTSNPSSPVSSLTGVDSPYAFRPGYPDSKRDSSTWSIIWNYGRWGKALCFLRVLSWVVFPIGLCIDKAVFQRYSKKLVDRLFVPSTPTKHYGCVVSERNDGGVQANRVPKDGKTVQRGFKNASSGHEFIREFSTELNVKVPCKGVVQPCEIPQLHATVFSRGVCDANTARLHDLPGEWPDDKALAALYPKAAPSHRRALYAASRVDWDNLTFVYNDPVTKKSTEWSLGQVAPSLPGQNRYSREELVLGQLTACLDGLEIDGGAQADYLDTFKFIMGSFCKGYQDLELPAKQYELKNSAYDLISAMHPDMSEQEILPGLDICVSALVASVKEMRQIKGDVDDPEWGAFCENLFKTRFVKDLETEERMLLYKGPVLAYVRSMNSIEADDVQNREAAFKTFVRDVGPENISPNQEAALRKVYQNPLESFLARVSKAPEGLDASFDEKNFWNASHTAALRSFVEATRGLNSHFDARLKRYGQVEGRPQPQAGAYRDVPGELGEAARAALEKQHYSNLADICLLLTPEARSIPFSTPPSVELHADRREIVKFKRVPWANRRQLRIDMEFTTYGSVHAFWGVNPNNDDHLYSRMELVPGREQGGFEAELKHVMRYKGAWGLDPKEMEIFDARFLAKWSGYVEENEITQ